ncbi:MAG: GNAT family N-acyltransferase [Bacteroidales bacterium]
MIKMSETQRNVGCTKNKKNDDMYRNLYISYYNLRNKSSSNISVSHNVSLIADFLSLYNISVSFDKEKIQKKLKINQPIVFVVNHNEGFLDNLVVLYVLLLCGQHIKIVKNTTNNSFAHDTDMFFDYPLSYHYIYSLLDTHVSDFLQNGSNLVFFPESKYTQMYQNNKHAWGESLFLFLKRLQVPIVPIYISTHRQKKVNTLPFVHNIKKDAHKIIYFAIGDIVSVKDQHKFTDIALFTRYIRASVYLLGYSKIEVKRYFNSVFLSPVDRMNKKALQGAVDSNLLQIEIEKLSEHLLFSYKQFDVYCVSGVRMPILMQEIGRLREYTFRKIGEGTMNSTDLDEYDLYYEHLFVWDSQKKLLVGAYRLGVGNEIINQYGKKGFYIHSLFKIKNEILPMLHSAIELGRSFVVPEYQKHPYALFLLWKGILHYMQCKPEYRYLIGAVSISNDFSELSKSLIVAYVQSYYYNHELARFFKPRKKFIISKDIFDDVHALVKHGDISNLDKQIKLIENNKLVMPVLLKKYLALNAQIINFNVDPLFNNCLDGLLLLDMQLIPKDTISNFS